MRALRGIDLEVKCGEFFGFLGPNGASKTTTIKLMLGLIHPTAVALQVEDCERLYWSKCGTGVRTLSTGSWTSHRKKVEMITQPCSKFMVLIAIGLVIAILAGFGTSVMAPAAASAASPYSNTNLPPHSSDQDVSDTEMDEKLAQFEGYLAEMQQELGIPGMSAAIVKDRELLWAQGFGYADVEANRPATADTPYEIASLTKPLSSTILLQLVEQGLVNLDDPVSKYGIHIKSPGVIRVRHLLGMTSLGDPGSFFAYSGDRYAYLQKVIERASDRSFPSLMIEAILTPLGMSNSIPIDMISQPAYTHILDNISKPYGMDQTYIESFSTAAGLVSTVLDLAKFDIALDQDQLIGPQTKTLAFTAQTLSSDDPPIYGLGWLTQEFQGTKMVWAFGYDAFSHLYLKFVDQGYTLIILTNNTAFVEYLSSRDWNVMRYPAVLEFYKLFIRDMALDELVDWDASEEVIAAQLQSAQDAGNIEIARQEIYNRYIKSFIHYNPDEAQKALATYTYFFAKNQPPSFTMQPALVKLDRAGNGTYAISEFTLEQDVQVDIYAVGEYFYGRMRDYGGIEDVSSGQLIWVMRPDQTEPAGGCAVNSQVIDQIELQVGTYRLHYRTSDWGHAFGAWDCLPPDSLFWGIALYAVGDDPNVAVRDIAPKARDELLAPAESQKSMALVISDKPIISNLEYGILWTCIGILLSMLVAVPILLWRIKDPAGTPKSARRWVKAAAWIAWVNSFLCSMHLFVSMIIQPLENFVTDPIVLVSTSPFKAQAFVGFSYACIVLTIIQAIFTILAWKGGQRSLAERAYYSLATLAAAGYILLLASWGLIAALY